MTNKQNTKNKKKIETPSQTFNIPIIVNLSLTNESAKIGWFLPTPNVSLVDQMLSTKWR
jgi:hypothetical protein